MHGDARIEGYHYCMPLETLSALNYNSFILTVGIMPVDLPESESISGAEINLTVCAVSNGVLYCNLAERKSVLKMCTVIR